MMNIQLANENAPAIEIIPTIRKTGKTIAKGVAMWNPGEKEYIENGLGAVPKGRYREAKPFGIVIRAFWGEKRVSHYTLTGKKVFFIIKKDKDHKGLDRIYLRLYSRPEDAHETTERELTIVRFTEKSTGVGSTAFGYTNGDILADTGPLSSGGGAHWEKQLIVWSSVEKELLAYIQRTGKRGCTWTTPNAIDQPCV